MALLTSRRIALIKPNHEARQIIKNNQDSKVATESKYAGKFQEIFSQLEVAQLFNALKEKAIESL